MGRTTDKVKVFKPKDQEILTEHLVREKFKKSLYLTSKHLIGDASHTINLINRRTHGRMINVLESDAKRKLVVMPRGCFKTTVSVESYCVWKIINNPNCRILIDSEVYTNSKNNLRTIKAHLEDPFFVGLFGEHKTKENWSDGSLTVKTRTQRFRESTITCSGVGAVKVGQHYDTIIMDDMNSDKNSGTEEGRQKIIHHYQMNQAILEPDGELIVIGTRYHANDLIGHILKNEIGVSYGESKPN